MIKDLISRLGGIESYGILSLLLFISVFAGMVMWSCLLRKPFLNRMARMPLDADPDQPSSESHRDE
jgi:hypothetical protein